MKTMKRIMVLAVALLTICVTLIGCGQLKSTVNVYKFDEWSTGFGYATVRDDGYLNGEEENAWEKIQNNFGKYATLHAGIKNSIMTSDRVLTSISMTIIPETSGELTFSAKSYYTTVNKPSNLNEQTVTVTAGEEHVVSFGYNKPITEVINKHINSIYGSHYILEICNHKFVEYEENSEVPTGAKTRQIDGKKYYYVHNNSIRYKVKSLTFVFDIEK